ncbi:MAG: L-lactate permease [Candidatus Nanoarchaeia archaeon]
MLAILALLPIILVIVLMGFFSWSAKRAMPLAALISFIIGLVVWKMPLRQLGAAIIVGSLTALDVLLIVFGALCLLAVLKKSNSLDIILSDFKQLTHDSRIHILLVGWLFVAFLEAVAGFGTPAAITAPLLFVLGVPILGAVAIPLMFEAIPVTFGAVGVPITIGIASGIPSLTNIALQKITWYAALLHGIVGLVYPLLILGFATRFFSEEKSWKIGFGAWKFALLTSISFLIPYLFSAYFLGPELPSVFGSIVAIGVSLLAVQKGWFLPKKTWSFKQGFKTKKLTQHSFNYKEQLRAWGLYIIIALILIITRLPFFKIGLWLQKCTIGVSNVLGTNLSYSLAILYSPGTLFFFVAIFSGLFLFKLKPKIVAHELFHVIKKLLPIAIVLLFTLVLVKILVHSDINASGLQSMLLVPAQYLAQAVGKFWFFFAPFVGSFGAFISGSNTISNLLFGSFQFQVASSVGVGTLLILALQAVGGGIGNMICIHNIVAACSTVSACGNEGKIFRVTIIPSLIYAAFIGLIGLLIVFFVL